MENLSKSELEGLKILIHCCQTLWGLSRSKQSWFRFISDKIQFQSPHDMPSNKGLFGSNQVDSGLGLKAVTAWAPHSHRTCEALLSGQLLGLGTQARPERVSVGLSHPEMCVASK